MTTTESADLAPMREHLSNLTMLMRLALYAWDQKDMAEVKRILRTIRYAAEHLAAAIFIAEETRDLPPGVHLTHG